ncbi:salicylate hydroxylase [Rhizobium sp. PP-CC-3A-592]|nr:salicylate hydroxylase [Rhizobium sp. PP-CC-3A-592]
MPNPAPGSDPCRTITDLPEKRLPDTRTPITVVGAGIAGLTAALSLAAKGFEVDIVERAANLDEVGAGLQLSPNATRILDALGLTARLQPHWVEPSEIRLVDGRSLRTIARVPAGAFARTRWQAPYAVMARSALQSALADAVRAHPLCRLHLDTAICDATPASLSAITQRMPGLIVGADGIGSKVRLAIAGHGKARLSGNIAWRLTLPRHAAPSPFDPTVVTAYLGRRAHLVAYPIGASGGLNLVAIGSGLTQADTSEEASRAAIAQLLSGWHPDIRSALSRAGTLGYWPLIEVEDGAWHDGTRILIGDAAHAMMPFAAQGAAMAIEDAFELAEAIGKPGDITAHLDAFVQTRKARVARVRARGAFNRFAYHASGPVRLGRNLVLSLRTPERLAEDFDWLYGHRLPGQKTP